MSNTPPQRRESHPPPANMPPGTTPAGKMFFLLRRFADIMVESVLCSLFPWLSQRTGTVLEVGCGAQPYRHFLPADVTYQGLDWERSEEVFSYKAPDTVYYAGDRFPFPDDRFDAVFHTEVIEHIFDTRLFLEECQRVLKPGGELFFAVPFQARYHYIPFDYWRFTPAALERLLTEAGFTAISIASRGNDITVACYKVISVIYRWLRGGIIGKLLGLVSLPTLLVSLLLAHISLRLPIGSRDDCLGYNVSARC